MKKYIQINDQMLHMKSISSILVYKLKLRISRENLLRYNITLTLIG
jgi:hypothetical protein